MAKDNHFGYCRRENSKDIYNGKDNIQRQSVDNFKARVVNFGYYREHGNYDVSHWLASAQFLKV